MISQMVLAITVSAVALGQSWWQGYSECPIRTLPDGSGRYLRSVGTDREWDELVVSWDVRAEPQAIVTVTAVLMPEGNRYVLAKWSHDPELRGSVNGQSDDLGKVATDTLVLKEPRKHVVLEVATEGGSCQIEHLDLCFTNSRDPGAAHGALGKPTARMAVPRLRQMDFPNGNVICSPTSLEMVIRYWSERTGAPISRPVPEVCDAVNDPNWPGTGNWPFNTAYAASLPEMRAYVARLNSLSDLESWVANGFPVVCSVSNDIMRAKQERRANDGHLVVVTGFDAEGNVLMNDPGREVTEQTVERARFLAAWNESRRTVYLVYPKWMSPPESVDQAWDDSRAPERLPDKWFGTWKGPLEVVGPDGRVSNRTDMTLDIRPVEGDGCMWRINYGGNDDRAYRLTTIDGSPGRFVIDEGNGIKLDCQLVKNVMWSTFVVNGTVLSARYELKDDTLIVEIYSSRGPLDGQVNSLVPKALQAATLRRRAPATEH